MAAEHAYGRVDRGLWHNDTFSVFSAAAPNAQTLWLYLLNGPFCTSIPGVLVCGVDSIAADLKWPVADARRCMDEIAVAGWAQVDHAAGLVWLPKSLKHNMPANPSVVRGWRALWPLVPACPLRTKIGEHFRRALRREDLRRVTASSRLTGQGLEFYVEVMLGEREAPPSSHPRSSRRSSQRPMAPPSSTPSGSWQAPHGVDRGHRPDGVDRVHGGHGVVAPAGVAAPVVVQPGMQGNSGVGELGGHDLYKARVGAGASDPDLISSGSALGSGSVQIPEERSPLPPKICVTPSQVTATHTDPADRAPITARSTAMPPVAPVATIAAPSAPLALVATPPTPKAFRASKRAAKQDSDPALLTAPERLVYAAIVADTSLAPIVACPATCAADLVGAAPGVDVPTAVRAAGAWLRAHPAQCKKNGTSFLLNWVNRRQERGMGGPSAAMPAAPGSGPIAPDVERTMRFFGANFTKVTGNVYSAPTADQRHAATLWADAQKGAREAQEQVIGDAYKPDAEACVRYWVGRYFRDANQKVKDANYPFAWLVSSIGGYGLPKRDPRPQGGSQGGASGAPTPRMVPVAPAASGAPEAQATVALTKDFTAGMLAMVTGKPGSYTTDQPLPARRK